MRAVTPARSNRAISFPLLVRNVSSSSRSSIRAAVTIGPKSGLIGSEPVEWYRTQPF